MTDQTPDPDLCIPARASPRRRRAPTRSHRTSSTRRFAGSPLSWVAALALAAVVGTLLFVGGYLAAGASGSSCVRGPARRSRRCARPMTS